MIYLIGGSPKCGKTTLAKELSKILGVSWLATDSLQCVVMPYMTEDEKVLKFPTITQRGKDNDDKYSKYSTTEIIEAYKVQAKTVREAIEIFIDCELADGNDHIIEGYHIEPEFVAGLNLKYPNQIKSVFLTKQDKEKVIQDIKKSTTPNDWILTRTHKEETFSKIAEMICEYGNYFKMESEKYGFRVLNMDEDFEGKIKKAINYFNS